MDKEVVMEVVGAICFALAIVLVLWAWGICEYALNDSRDFFSTTCFNALRWVNRVSH